MKQFDARAWLLPQPVLIIGTYDADGKPNAMNAAWAGTWDEHKVMISMGSHATTDNLKRCGDFTIAFATRDTMTAADYVGLVSARKVADKMGPTDWQAEKAAHVNAPRFACFPMTLECRVVDKFDESNTGCYLIAEIVSIAVDEQYLAADGKPDVSKMQLITFDPVHHTYIELGETVGKAFSDGLKLKPKA